MKTGQKSSTIWAPALRLRRRIHKNSASSGTIIYQDKANKVIGIRETINITVSLGNVVYVPDFVAPEGSGYGVAVTREVAMEMCEEAGIVAVFEEEDKAGRPARRSVVSERCGRHGNRRRRYDHAEIRTGGDSHRSGLYRNDGVRGA